MHLELFVKKGSFGERCPCVLLEQEHLEPKPGKFMICQLQREFEQSPFCTWWANKLLIFYLFACSEFATLMHSSYRFDSCVKFVSLHVLPACGQFVLCGSVGCWFVWQVSNICMLPSSIGVMWYLSRVVGSRDRPLKSWAWGFAFYCCDVVGPRVKYDINKLIIYKK